MADKLTDRLEANSADGNDYIHVVDVSDITDNFEGTSKKIKKSNFLADIVNQNAPITLTGDASGTGTTTINVTVANDSHTHDSRYYTESESNARFLGINAKATDSNLLDGFDSTYFYPASNPNGYTNDQTPTEILTAIKTVDGSGSGLDADLYHGYDLSAGGNRWGVMAEVRTDGVMNVGKYIDFHNTDGTAGLDGRITLNSTNNWTFSNGAITASRWESNAITSNSVTATDSTRLDGYGIMGNRASATYFTNGAVGGSVKIGNGGVHNIKNIAIFDDNGLSVVGTVTATAFFESSDKRLKNNIEPISDTFCSFELNNIEGKRYGVIAQDIELTNPELVNTNDEGLKSVNYIDLLCLKVAELENKIKELENK